MGRVYDVEVHKHRVETALADYEQAREQFVIWLDEWRKLNKTKGFRCVRRNENPNAVKR